MRTAAFQVCCGCCYWPLSTHTDAHSTPQRRMTTVPHGDPMRGPPTLLRAVHYPRRSRDSVTLQHAHTRMHYAHQRHALGPTQPSAPCPKLITPYPVTTLTSIYPMCWNNGARQLLLVLIAGLHSAGGSGGDLEGDAVKGLLASAGDAAAALLAGLLDNVDLLQHTHGGEDSGGHEAGTAQTPGEPSDAAARVVGGGWHVRSRGSGGCCG